MRQISQNYLNKKTECIQGMQDIEDKMREIENNKEDEKRMMMEEIERLKNEGNNKIKDYLNKKNIKKIYFTDREIIDKQFKKKENTNLKCLNNIYINKKNIS